MIKGLLKKDLYNLASYKTTLIIIVIFCGMAIIGTDAIYWGSVVIGIIVGMISLSTFSYDEFNNVKIFYPDTGETRLFGEDEASSYFDSNENDFICTVRQVR